MTGRRLCSAGRGGYERKGGWETPNRGAGSGQGTPAENAGFGSEIRALHTFLHLIYLPGHLPYKDPLELWWRDLPLGTEGEKVKCQR